MKNLQIIQAEGGGVSFFPNHLIAIILLLLSSAAGGPAVAQTEEELAEGPYTVSPETTGITGPRNQDGTLDFYAAINRHMSNGVTGENNAARLLYAVLPDRFDGSHTFHRIQQLRRDLDIEFLPEDSPRLVDLQEFAERNRAPDFVEEFLDWYDRPMRAKSRPLLLEFMQQNDAALDVIVEASGRPRFFVPLRAIGEISGEGVDDDYDFPEINYHTLVSSDLWHIQINREFARLLYARAMIRTAQGEYPAAWSDILAMRRLGQLTGTQASLVEGLVGIVVTGMACEAAARLIEKTTHPDHAGPVPDWNTMLADWSAPWRVADLRLQCNLGERLICIEYITLVADGRVGFSEVSSSIIGMGGPVAPAFAAEAVDEAIRAANRDGFIDWNEGLRWCNTLYDRHISNLNLVNPAERKAAWEKLDQQLARMESTLPAMLANLGHDDTSPGDRARAVGGMFLCMLAPSMEQVANAELRIEAWQKTIALGLACLADRGKTGSFPDSLAQLAETGKIPAELIADFGPETDLSWSRTGTGCQLRYRSQISEGLNFELNIGDPQALQKRDADDDDERVLKGSG